MRGAGSGNSATSDGPLCDDTRTDATGSLDFGALGSCP